MGFLTDAIAWARMRCHRLSTTEMTDDEITLILLPVAGLAFSKLAPIPSQHALQLGVNQVLYDLPDPKILEIRFHGSPLMQTPASMLGSNYYFPIHGHPLMQHSTVEISMYAREQAQRFDVHSVNIIGGKIQVLPSPPTAMPLQLFTADAWDFPDADSYDAIPLRLRNCFRYVLTAELADHVAQEQSKMPELGVGSSRVRVNWEALKSLASEMRDKARGESDQSLGLEFIQG